MVLCDCYFPATSNRLIKPQIYDPLPTKPCEIKVLRRERHSSKKMLDSSIVFATLVFTLILVPVSAEASVFSQFIKSAEAVAVEPSTSGKVSNSQNMPLAMASIGPGMLDKDSSGAGDVVINDAALAPSIGPVGNESAVDEAPENGGQISVYVVRKGDTLSSIAKMFDVTKTTIIAFNNLPSGTTVLKEGTVLNILPISGIMHTVVKNDTLKSIAKKYKVEIGELAVNNDISIDDDLQIGDTLIVPQSNEAVPAKPSSKKTTTAKIPAYIKGAIDLGDVWARPIAGGRFSQDLHGARHTGIDIAAPAGTPIMAAADGVVLVAQATGYNTGYGQLIVINHTINGRNVQTLYAHSRKIFVTAGQRVSKGQVIAEVGRTGRSTGTHLHFEVNGAANPFHNNPNFGL